MTPIQQIADLVRELTEPEKHREQVDEMAFVVRRHAGVDNPGWHIRVFPSLIDQLRIAITWDEPVEGGPGAKSSSESSPPGNDEALDALIRIENGVAKWVAGEGRLDVKDRLRQTVGLATMLGDADVAALRRDLATWRAVARVETGWDRRTFTCDLPCPACEHKSLRIRGDGSAARCSHCGAAWSEDVRDDLPGVFELGEVLKQQRIRREEEAKAKQRGDTQDDEVA